MTLREVTGTVINLVESVGGCPVVESYLRDFLDGITPKRAAISKLRVEGIPLGQQRL